MRHALFLNVIGLFVSALMTLFFLQWSFGVLSHSVVKELPLPYLTVLLFKWRVYLLLAPLILASIAMTKTKMRWNSAIDEALTIVLLILCVVLTFSFPLIAAFSSYLPWVQRAM